ncbi:MAG: fibronectin type III domain-containing protein [Roseburia sp.]|nr:fibronectin type III domain-containing protein [Roseburia sp.]
MKFVKKALVFLFVMILSLSSLKSISVLAAEPSLLTITKTYGDGPFNIGFSSNGNGKMTYSSSNKKVVTVSKSGKVTIKGCGVADIKIKAAANGKYKAKSSTVTIIVKPTKQKITNLKLQERNITVKWNKDTKADGYYIYYSTDYKFSNDLHIIKVSKNKTTSRIIKNLKTGKKYYVKVCSYKKSGKQTVLGSFSSIRNVTIKK